MNLELISLLEEESATAVAEQYSITFYKNLKFKTKQTYEMRNYFSPLVYIISVPLSGTARASLLDVA